MDSAAKAASLGTWVALVAIACGGDTSPVVMLPQPARSGGEAGAAGAPVPRVAKCDQAPDGTPCGDPGMHCVFNVCVRNLCGDGVKGEGEQCDDGDRRDGDGCDSHCKNEAPPGCGNGVLEPGEECDDAGKHPGRCTPTCAIARCGDGTVSPGEECDDGNSSDRDSCTTRCIMPASLCGNGLLETEIGEECDDGNKLDDFLCAANCRFPDPCGNGVVEAGEACDDGNTSNGDTCTAECALPPVTAGSGGSGGSEAGSGGEAGSAGAAGAGAGTGGAGADAGQGGAGGNSGQSGAGAGGAGAGAGGAGMGGGGAGGMIDAPNGIAHLDEACRTCREAVCVDLEGLNYLDGCFGPGKDPIWRQKCVDVLDCAFTANSGAGCAYGPTGAGTCWCGTATPTQCSQDIGINGPCMAEFKAATDATTNAEVNARIRSLTYPSGQAVGLVECDRDYCLAECGP